jgi:hypothetical protein
MSEIVSVYEALSLGEQSQQNLGMGTVAGRMIAYIPN